MEPQIVRVLKAAPHWRQELPQMVIAERINSAIRSEDAPLTTAPPPKPLPAASIIESVQLADAEGTIPPSVAEATALASSTNDGSDNVPVHTPPRRAQQPHAARNADMTDAVPLSSKLRQSTERLEAGKVPAPPPLPSLYEVTPATANSQSAAAAAAPAGTATAVDEATPVPNAWFVSPASPESEMKHRPSRNAPTPTPPPVKPSSPALSPTPPEVSILPAAAPNTNIEPQDSRSDDCQLLRKSISVSSSSRADVIHDSSDESSGSSDENSGSNDGSPRSRSTSRPGVNQERGAHDEDDDEEPSYSEDDNTELHGLACQSHSILEAIAEAAAMAATAASNAAQASTMKVPPPPPPHSSSTASSARKTEEYAQQNEGPLESIPLVPPSCDASLTPSPSSFSPEKPQFQTAAAAAAPSSPSLSQKSTNNFEGQIAPNPPGTVLGSPFRPLPIRRSAVAAANAPAAHETATSGTAVNAAAPSAGGPLCSLPCERSAPFQEEHNNTTKYSLPSTKEGNTKTNPERDSHTRSSEHLSDQQYDHTQRFSSISTAVNAASNENEGKIKALWDVPGRSSESSSSESSSGITTAAASSAASSTRSNKSSFGNSGHGDRRGSNPKGEAQVPLHSSKLILERFGLLDHCEESTAHQSKHHPRSTHFTESVPTVNESGSTQERSFNYLASCAGSSGRNSSYMSDPSEVEHRRSEVVTSVHGPGTSSSRDQGGHHWSSGWPQPAQSQERDDNGDEEENEDKDSFLGEAWAAEGLTAEQALLKRFHSAFEWMASTLETAEAAHAAALDDAISKERANAARDKALQAASIAREVKQQAMEQAVKQVEGRIAEAISTIEARAAGDVAALRDQHSKDQACVAQDLAELQRLHGEKCRRYEASISDLKHQLQCALRAQAECQSKCQAETQAAACEVQTYYEHAQRAEARGREIESEFNAKREGMENAFSAQSAEMESSMHARLSELECEFNARAEEIECAANARVAETENALRAQQRTRADEDRNQHLTEVAALRESHAHEVEVAVAAAVGAVSDAAATRAQAAAAGATQREAAAMAKASAHVRRLEAENAELRRQLQLVVSAHSSHSSGARGSYRDGVADKRESETAVRAEARIPSSQLPPQTHSHEQGRQQQQETSAAPAPLSREHHSPPRKEYSQSVPNTPLGHERSSSTAARGAGALPPRCLSSRQPLTSSMHVLPNNANDATKSRTSSTGVVPAHGITSTITTTLSGQKRSSIRSAPNTPQRRTFSSAKSCLASAEVSSSTKRVPLKTLVNRQTSQGVGQQVGQQISSDYQPYWGSYSRGGLPPRPPPHIPPSPLPPKYQEEYQDEYAWAQEQQAHSQPHLLDLPPQTARGAAEDIVYADDDRYAPIEPASCEVKHEDDSESEVKSDNGGKAGPKSRSHVKARRGALTGKSSKAKAKGKTVGKATGKATHRQHHQHQGSKTAASEGGVLSGQHKARPIETAMRRRRQEALREVL